MTYKQKVIAKCARATLTSLSDNPQHSAQQQWFEDMNREGIGR